MAAVSSMEVSTGEGQFTISLDPQWNNNHPCQQGNSADSFADLVHEDFGNSGNIGKVNKRSNIGTSEKNPTSVARRNARERRRIKNVNSAFDELRQHVPNGERNRKKISKVDTLQSAIEYIKALEGLVRNRNKGNNTKKNESDDADKENVPCNNNSADDNCEIGLGRSNSPPCGSENGDVIFIGSSANAVQVRQSCDTENQHLGQENDFDKATAATNNAGRNTKQSPVVLTESMLKAFDVMLEKCGSKKAKKDSVAQRVDVNGNGDTQQLDINYNLQAADPTQYDMQSQSSDSGFSEIFNEQRDLDAIDQNIPLPRQRQSSLQLCFEGVAETQPDFDIAASPILSDHHDGQSYQINDLNMSSLQVQSPVNEPTFTVLSSQVTNFNQEALYGQPYTNQQYGFRNHETHVGSSNLQNRFSSPAENYFNFNNTTPSTFDDKPGNFDNIFPQNAMSNWLTNPELTTLEQISPTLNVLPPIGQNLEPVFQKTSAVFSAFDVWNGAL